jgi:hypothetical protein
VHPVPLAAAAFFVAMLATVLAVLLVSVVTG